MPTPSPEPVPAAEAAAEFVEDLRSLRFGELVQVKVSDLASALAALIRQERAAMRERCVEEVNSTDMNMADRTLVVRHLRALPLE